MKYLLLLAGAACFAYLTLKRESGIKSILFVGDSNTALPFSYAYKLQKQFPGIRCKILAKIGAQTGWMMDELKKELQSKSYDAICILGGSNDIYATDSIENAKRNLFSMYAAASSAGAMVIGITPPNKDYYTKRTEKRQRLLYELVSWIFQQQRPGAVINFHGMTKDKAFFTSKDGFLHAQEPAHNYLAAQVAETLRLK